MYTRLNNLGILLKRYNNFRRIGISFRDFNNFRKNTKSGNFQSLLYGKKIHLNNPFWYLHSIEELFVDEVYKFNSKVDNPYIIDCGANIGLSIIYFKQKFPNCKILAFEADNEIFKILTKNIELFDYNGVDIRNSAVWNENTQLRFFSDGALGGKISNEKDSTQDFVEVKAIKLSEHLSNCKIDFLKIDIEGSEFTVLNSCREYLVNVDKLFVEYHSDTKTPQMLSELLQIIKDAGFRYYIKEAWENMKFPYIENQRNFYYDMQLNIFCYR